VPTGYVIESAAQIEAAAAAVGFPCVVKAQVLQGGRGKAGLIR
jgi:succinyl-CoA synthetase beta subunit